MTIKFILFASALALGACNPIMQEHSLLPSYGPARPYGLRSLYGVGPPQGLGPSYGVGQPQSSYGPVYESAQAHGKPTEASKEPDVSKDQQTSKTSEEPKEPPVESKEPELPVTYSYKYEVTDPKSKNFLSKSEIADGQPVKGVYTLQEADGTKRIAEYADLGNGFTAVVKKEGIPESSPAPKPSEEPKQVPSPKPVEELKPAPFKESYIPRPVYGPGLAYGPKPAYEQAPIMGAYGPGPVPVYGPGPMNPIHGPPPMRKIFYA